MGGDTGQPAPGCDKDAAMWLEPEDSTVVPRCKRILVLVEDEAVTLNLEHNVSAE